ncbi:oxidoreductase domain protein [Mycobacterium ulcerans str. Harvey]|uniref:Oxidoreductase domain protein n=1 Tax=Mycobacterium ulcerans str. Harvey TaxID=1299332 RepID=A0ABN0R055_MYCUL|nr:oxidoreductase domain protein [Mycobacterium ulcerans str. Harvey]
MSQPALCIHDVDVVGEPFEDMMAMLDAPVFVVTTQPTRSRRVAWSVLPPRPACSHQVS